MNKPFSFYLSVAGLLCLMIALPWWLYANAPGLGILGAAIAGGIVPALLIYAVLRQTRNWSGITALCMIPLASIGIMDIVANLRTPDSGMVIGIVSITVFLAVLDAARRIEKFSRPPG